MTAKEIVRLLKSVKEECAAHQHTCKGCIYTDMRLIHCKAILITNEMHGRSPEYWDIEEMEEIANK